MKKIINTTKAPTPIGPYSQAVLSNNTLYLSGQIALNPKTMELPAPYGMSIYVATLRFQKEGFSKAKMEFPICTISIFPPVAKCEQVD